MEVIQKISVNDSVTCDIREGQILKNSLNLIIILTLLTIIVYIINIGDFHGYIEGSVLGLQSPVKGGAHGVPVLRSST